MTVLQGVDVGGTSIKGVALDEHGTVCDEWAEPTPRNDPSGRRTLETIVSRIGASAVRDEIDAVGIVVPGLIDEVTGVCLRSVNLNWTNVTVARPVNDALGLPVAFGHDVRAGALAEARTGVSSGTTGIAAFLPIGTGLAAAYTRNGQLLEFGTIAGEVGQVRLVSGEYAGSTIEQLASAGAIAQRLGLPDARAAAELVRAGNVEATLVWNHALDLLSDIIAWIAVTIAPQTVVIGGGLSASADLLLEPLTVGLAARVADGPLPRIVPAAYGARAGALGATELASDLLARITRA